MWKELPDYPYQLVYASTKAIAERREALVRTLAGYARLYRFLSTNNSWPAYSKARMAATGEKEAEAGRPAWNFIQEMKPFAVGIEVAPAQIAFLQRAARQDRLAEGSAAVRAGRGHVTGARGLGEAEVGHGRWHRGVHNHRGQAPNARMA